MALTIRVKFKLKLKLNHLIYLNLVCSKYRTVYDNFIFMGDFNVAMSGRFLFPEQS